MLVPELVKNRVYPIPYEFYESIPQYCFEANCRYPMEISETLTQLHCSNPRCPSKLVQRLVAMANQLGVKPFGETHARKFLNRFGVDNPLYIFGYNPLQDGDLEGMSHEACINMAEQFWIKKTFTLSEYVRIANLPFIQTSATAIFGNFDDLGKAYEEIERGGVEYIRSKLSIKKGDDDTQTISLRAAKIYETLMIFRRDLMDCVGYVNIIKTQSSGLTSFKAVCSDEVGSGFTTKADFYATVNNKYSDIHVEFLNAVTKSIDYLIWAGADGSPARETNKVKKVRAYNEKYEANKESGMLKDDEHYIPILTAGQFITKLDEMSKHK